MRISPKAKRLASERDVNLAEVRGSGPGGEILASDVLAAAESKIDVPTISSERVSVVSRLMAERTTESWTTVPHFFLARDVDAAAFIEMRQKLVPEIEKNHGVKLTYSDLLVSLVARSLTKYPMMNASWTGKGIRENAEINIGLAVAVDDGVVAPVIRSAWA